MEDLFLINAINQVKQSWKSFFDLEIKKDYFFILDNKLKKDFEKKEKIFPIYDDIFNAFKFFEVNETKLVILGQDPYHIENMADGLAFSTKLNIIPKSLNNIFKELENDFQIKRKNPNLIDIAQQNVLLLNTILTVKQNKALSHKNYGWEIFSKNLISYLSNINKNVIYLLMGNNAIEYEKFINNSLAIFKTSHPSPLSYHVSLKKSKTFKKINDLLKEKEIKW